MSGASPFASLANQIEENLDYDWESIARPEQRLPLGDWLFLLMLAGRGWGKSRTLAETVREWIKQGFNHVNIIGATMDDVRTIMIEGPSGILACCPPSERPEYLRRSFELRWPNGAISLLFSAEEPDRLRGKQHMKLACDEVASWRDIETWNQALFGLRLGKKPQVVIATTPRPIKIIRELIKDPRTVVVRGSTYDNKANLSGDFIGQITQRFEGTRLGRQELYAEILDDVQGALWSRDLIERTRCTAVELPPLKRIVVAIDPAVSLSGDSNETGILCAAKGVDEQFYVLQDASGKYAPIEWARRAIGVYRKWNADRIVAEINQGGAMVESTIRSVDSSVPFRSVTATRGKIVRAEPIAALFEQGRGHLAGTFPQLEYQLCTFEAGSTTSPDRLDAMVWAMTSLNDRRPTFVFG